jgi:hypothetical protein
MPKIRHLTDKQIKKALFQENPWWVKGNDWQFREQRKRLFFNSFVKVVTMTEVHRAVLLLGPRRVGKTWMLSQSIQYLLENGVPANRILYASLENPTNLGKWLEDFLEFLPDPLSIESVKNPIDGMEPYSHFVFFDEIQYLNDWQLHLKSLVDRYPNVKFIVSGSAAATLRRKSIESGAGRFRTFELPPLSFAEFCHFSELNIPDNIGAKDGLVDYTQELTEFNDSFINYLNYGGFPEAVLAAKEGIDVQEIISRDVLDRVLLMDLPSIHGIDDPRELYRFLAVIALNTGMEVSVRELAQSSNVAENTLRKYLEFLEAAFLITILTRVDDTAKRFKRRDTFKVYLTNPSLRSALFGPISNDDDQIGGMVETAVFAQHYRPSEYVNDTDHYARWGGGEVDLVSRPHPAEKPNIAVEIKWSNRIMKTSDPIKNLVYFSKRNKIKEPILLTKAVEGQLLNQDVLIKVYPAAIYCYIVSMSAHVAHALKQSDMTEEAKRKFITLDPSKQVRELFYKE